MANLYNINGRTEKSGGDPTAGWVYQSQHRMFWCKPSVGNNTDADLDYVGHMIQKHIAPSYCVVQTSVDSPVCMAVDGSRWTAATLQAALDEFVGAVPSGDVTWTVTASTGAFMAGDSWASDFEREIGAAGTSWFTDARFDGDPGSEIDVAGGKAYIDTDANAAYTRFANKVNEWNLGDYDTGRYNTYPGDMPVGTENLVFFAVQSDEFDDPQNAADDIYDLNGSGTGTAGLVERIIQALNPMAYTFYKENETDVYLGGGDGAELVMMFNGGDMDRVSLDTRVRNIVPVGSGLTIWSICSAPDFVFYGTA